MREPAESNMLVCVWDFQQISVEEKSQPTTKVVMNDLRTSHFKSVNFHKKSVRKCFISGGRVR